MLSLLGGTTAVLATGLPSYADAAGDRVPDDLLPGGAFDRFVAAQAAADAFSGSVLLTHRGRPVLARSYGKADKQRSVPNGPGTRFALASVTKLFTAVAIAQLAQQRKVAYGATVGEYLAGFPAAIAGKVSIHHLLTHTSGLGDYHQTPGFWEKAATWTSRDAVMDGITEFIRQSALIAVPGVSWNYSNSGYHLLGAIVAQASGQSYYDYVSEHVFRRAGMVGTGFYTRPQRLADPRIARPYTLQPSGERVDIAKDLLYVGTPSGDAFATCADLDRFANALSGAKLLDPAFTQLTVSGKLPLPPPLGPPPPPPPPTTTPPTMFQGYGPLVGLVNGRSVVGHGGGSPSASTSVETYPDLGWNAVVLSNYGEAARPIVTLAHRIITAL
ncbi:serine hydrolase domain-containing protein [Streptomyces sp. SID13031]|uniref:serine hydrolase domain-containing protein n=1 Tax=Streptomyces sp. SID13031 TaxID=2706046 RepID=UPI001945790A|nr:serine hydrolase domain-containing protein [Streptomyces sp. SID13031]